MDCKQCKTPISNHVQTGWHRGAQADYDAGKLCPTADYEACEEKAVANRREQAWADIVTALGPETAANLRFLLGE